MSIQTPKRETVFFADTQGEGLVLENGEYFEDRGEINVGTETLTIGKSTTLDGFFDFPHEFRGFNGDRGMVFWVGFENDLFGGVHYYKVIHFIKPTRLFVLYKPGSGRDWNFVNGEWK